MKSRNVNAGMVEWLFIANTTSINFDCYGYDIIAIVVEELLNLAMYSVQIVSEAGRMFIDLHNVYWDTGPRFVLSQSLEGVSKQANLARGTKALLLPEGE